MGSRRCPRCRHALQEAREADLILHLIDASDPNRWQRVRQVNSVLKQLDADKVPQIRVYNKIDKLDRRPRVANNRHGEGRAVWLSATSTEGVDILLEAIESRLKPALVHGYLNLGAAQGRQRAKLFELGAVINEAPNDEGGWLLEVNLAERDLRRFLKRENLPDDILAPMTTDVATAAH